VNTKELPFISMLEESESCINTVISILEDYEEFQDVSVDKLRPHLVMINERLCVLESIINKKCSEKKDRHE
jgi:hypothetical protein